MKEVLITCTTSPRHDDILTSRWDILFYVTKFIPYLSASPRFFSPYFSWPDSCTRSQWVWPWVEVVVRQSLLSSEAGVLKKGIVRTDHREPFSLQTSQTNHNHPQWNQQYLASPVKHLVQYCALILTKCHPRVSHWVTQLNPLPSKMDACCYVKVREKRLKSLKCKGDRIIHNIVLVKTQWTETLSWAWTTRCTFPLSLNALMLRSSLSATPVRNLK